MNEQIATLEANLERYRGALQKIFELTSMPADADLIKQINIVARNALPFFRRTRQYSDRGARAAKIRPGTKAFIDLTDRIFGGWTILKQATDRAARTTWRCRCICGTFKDVFACHLISGKSRSCGCLRPRGFNSPKFKHGKSETTMHIRWMAIIQRCENKNNKAYRDYGGRGIKICARWRNDFELFLADIGNPPTPKHSIDRIDVNGNYEPGNCRWATALMQAHNKRPRSRLSSNSLVTHERLLA